MRQRWSWKARNRSYWNAYDYNKWRSSSAGKSLEGPEVYRANMKCSHRTRTWRSHPSSSAQQPLPLCTRSPEAGMYGITDSSPRQCRFWRYAEALIWSYQHLAPLSYMWISRKTNNALSCQGWGRIIKTRLDASSAHAQVMIRRESSSW